jgi:PPM family protein phosphatase
LSHPKIGSAFFDVQRSEELQMKIQSRLNCGFVIFGLLISLGLPIFLPSSASAVICRSAQLNKASDAGFLARLKTQSTAYLSRLFPKPVPAKSPYTSLVEDLVMTGQQYGQAHFLAADGSHISVLSTATRGNNHLKPTPKYLHNEDSVGIFLSPDHLSQTIVVADGMGGHGSGEIASEVAIRSVGQGLVNQQSIGDIIYRIPDSIQRRFEREQKNGNDVSPSMGTTIVVGQIANGTLEISQVGDARAAVFRQGENLFTTTDHSLPREMGLSEEEAMIHPQNNMVTKSLMIEEGNVEGRFYPTQKTIELERGDIIVMSSDGLTDMVSTAEINHIVNSTADQDPLMIQARLLALVTERLGRDNITIVVVRYGPGPSR